MPGYVLVLSREQYLGNAGRRRHFPRFALRNGSLVAIGEFNGHGEICLKDQPQNRIANQVARFFAAVAANRDACEEVTGAVATPRTDPSTLPAASKPQGMTPTQNRRSWTDIFGARQRPQHHNCQYQGPGGPQLHASCGQLTVEALLKDPQNPEARLSCCHALSTVAFPSIRSTLARPLASSPHHPSSGTIHSTLTRTGPDLWEEGPMDVRR